MRDRIYCVYMLASGRNGTLCISVTGRLVERVEEHQRELVDGFSKAYGTKSLVWYEAHRSPYEAITREKQIKQWRRAWKIRLIEAENPYGTIFPKRFLNERRWVPACAGTTRMRLGK